MVEGEEVDEDGYGSDNVVDDAKIEVYFEE